MVGVPCAIIWDAHPQPRPTSEQIQTCFLSQTPTFLPLSLLFAGFVSFVLPLLQDKAGLLVLLHSLLVSPGSLPLTRTPESLSHVCRGWYFSHSAFIQKRKDAKMQGSPERYGLNWSHQHVAEFPDHLLVFFPESLAPRGLCHFYSLFCSASLQFTSPVLGLAAFLSHCQSLWKDPAKEKADTELVVCQLYWSICASICPFAYYSCNEKPCSWGGTDEKVLFSSLFQLLFIWEMRKLVSVLKQVISPGKCRRKDT